MPLVLSDRTIDLDFMGKIIEISGQPVKTCMQCGTCAGVCPMDVNMELSPRKLLHLVQLGQKERVLTANTAWICASCHTCEVRCPRGLDIPRIMEAVRLLTLRENRNHIEPNRLDKVLLQDAPQIAMVSAFRKHTA